MIVDSNLNYPLSYVDPTYQTLLYVRATILDLSGVSPVVEDTVDLVRDDNGIYREKYQFTAGKLYQVKTLVYTDNTYTTVDEEFPQVVLDLQCVDLQSGGTVDLTELTNLVKHAVASLPNDLKSTVIDTDLKSIVSLEPEIKC